VSLKEGFATALRRLAGKKKQAAGAVKPTALTAAKGAFPQGSAKTAPSGEGAPPGSSAEGKASAGGAAPKGTAEGKYPAGGKLPQGTAGTKVPEGFRGSIPQTARKRDGNAVWREPSSPAFTQGEAVPLAGPPIDRARELSELLRVQRRLRPTAGEFGEEVL